MNLSPPSDTMRNAHRARQHALSLQKRRRALCVHCPTCKANIGRGCRDEHGHAVSIHFERKADASVFFAPRRLGPRLHEARRIRMEAS